MFKWMRKRTLREIVACKLAEAELSLLETKERREMEIAHVELYEVRCERLRQQLRELSRPRVLEVEQRSQAAPASSVLQTSQASGLVGPDPEEWAEEPRPAEPALQTSMHVDQQ